MALAVAFSCLATGTWDTGVSAAQVPAGQQLAFEATAYCDRGITKAGVRARRGVVAADPDVLPDGSVVRVRTPGQPRYEGIYTVMDTGSAVQGRRIDVFVDSCHEAKQFGLRRVLVRVLRFGWHPRASAPAASPGQQASGGQQR